MEWLAVLVFAGFGYATALLTGWLTLSIDRQPELSPLRVGSIRVIGLGISILALVFALTLTGYAAADFVA
ncbi:hypothetical protein [Halovivax gelatinilyticus]|uniref:hypothetical protein n=1 Tax=Halovivax gelatinilyticus TaxID=2961597 RepID=UPI0020CA2D9F|nr:hypothetical protein [Halovivax gelatinilyticus]